MENQQVFVSYESSSIKLCEQVVSYLESNNISCWYAPRNIVSGGYSTAICNALDNVKIFVVLLDEKSSNSQQVLNEVEMAFTRFTEDQNSITIIPIIGEDKNISRPMQYYIKRMQWIDYSKKGIDAALLELKNKIELILGVSKPSDAPVTRKITASSKFTDITEIKRLHIQQNALYKYDKELIDKISPDFDELNILDVGCHEGDYINRIFKGKNVHRIIGLDYNEECVNIANSKFGGEQESFYLCNVEQNLDEVITKALEEKGIEQFDIIHVSMVLFHLNNPRNVLKRLRKYLVKGGYIIIKDVDDAFTLAYPDTDGIFEQAIELCLRDPGSGNRHNGRTIPYILEHTGYRDVDLKNVGMSTCGMDFDDREVFFDLYFGDIKYDYENYLYNKGDKSFEKGVRFFNEHFEQMKDAFLENEFFFNLGFMQFVARR